MSSLSNFYNNLSSNGVFFFWIVIFLFLILVLLLIILFAKNRKLLHLIKEDSDFKVEEKVIDDSKNDDNITYDVKSDDKKEEIKLDIFDRKTDVVPEIKTDQSLLEQETMNNKEEILKKEIEYSLDNEKNVTGPYQKNILREINSRTQTSPIHINRDSYYSSKDNFFENDSDLANAYIKEDTLSPLVEMDDSYEASDDMKKLVELMEKENKPSNIELTDYEKKQEEEAIISYDELLKVKDKIYNITDDEETDEFIDELKNFRLDLQ